MKPKKIWLCILAPFALLAACAEPNNDDDSGDESSSGGDSTTFGSSTSSTGSSDTGANEVSECQPFGEPCADGLKCMPYDRAPVELSWDANGCFPLAAELSVPGDACTVYESAVDGLDNCAVGAMCLPSDFEDLSKGGTCIAFCEGSAEAAQCSTATETCVVANEGVLNLCLEMCDPVMQDCAPGEGCYLNPTDNKFFCFQQDETASGVPSNFADPCGTLNFCDPGLQCDEAVKTPGCEAEEYCCTEFCDLMDADPDAMCSGYEEGQRCLPHFGDQQAPPGFEHVGLCSIPQ